MDFITPGCASFNRMIKQTPIKEPALHWGRSIFLGWVCLYPMQAHAQDREQPEPGPPRFIVHSADTTLVNGVYTLNASIEYEFGRAVLEALENGVPLTLQLSIQILHPRRLLWNEEFTSLQQRYRLEYHALSQQYLVKNLNSGLQYNFHSRQDAITVLGAIVDVPILDQRLLTPGQSYIGRLRARLDIEALPTPLLLMAYLSPQWHLTSEWYTWPLQS